MHGDYKLDNVLWSRQPPPRVLSVVDFEMTTVGDPLIDLAWALIFWPEEGNLIALAAPGNSQRHRRRPVPDPGQLVQRYAAATGRDLSAFDWYQAFSAWKLAIVLEASYAKFLQRRVHATRTTKCSDSSSTNCSRAQGGSLDDRSVVLRGRPRSSW